MIFFSQVDRYLEVIIKWEVRIRGVLGDWYFQEILLTNPSLRSIEDILVYSCMYDNEHNQTRSCVYNSVLGNIDVFAACF